MKWDWWVSALNSLLWWMPKSMARGDGGTERGTLAYCSFIGGVTSFLSFPYLLKPLSKIVLLTNQIPLKSLYLIWCPEKSWLFSSVQFICSVVSDWPFATPWTAERQASLSITTSRSSLRLTSIESVMPSSHLVLCLPLLLLPPIPPSIKVFSNESTLCMRWPKNWRFSFSIIPSKEHSALISFRMDWLDLLAAQGTLKSLLQHHSSKASILQRSAFFTVHFSHPYMTNGKTIALTRRTFVDKVMSLHLNMLVPSLHCK